LSKNKKEFAVYSWKHQNKYEFVKKKIKWNK